MDKRFFLALFLSLIVIAISQVLFPPPAPVRPPAATGDSTGVVTPPASSETRVQAPVAASTTPAPPSDSVLPPGVAGAESTVVTVPKVIYTFSNIGAAPVSIVIRDYQNRSPSGGLVDLSLPGLPLLGFRLAAGGDTVDLRRVPFSLVRGSDAERETLTYNAGAGTRQIAITYAIPHDTAASYSLQVSGRVTGGEGQSYVLVDLPSSMRSVEEDTIADQRSLAYSFKPQRDYASSVLFGDLDPGEQRLQPGPLKWLAVKSKYFVLGVLPETGGSISEATLTGGPRTSKTATNAFGTAVIPVDSETFAFDVYAGPQESQRLFRMGREFDQVNPYGWGFFKGVLHPIASEIIRGLLWMHNRLELSYGWVLIILGVLIRLALWPLNQSAMRSSLKMQEIQPRLQAAQKKYKDDPLKQREAIMKVYKEADVSPFAGLTGCLPALLPMPILIALFFVFQNTIEFRGVPFMWLHDISVKDPYYILPLLMGASMFLLSWIGMRNAPPNPQAKMMMYMFPVVMTVVLLNMASGLNLYYTAQNIAALPQQWLLARERAKARALKP
ncbi:MAG TPA: membrane protein insertase YidC [Gemmatimonadaceae bacterium]|nr:membrane protein insertase YidC [Gemmatimonadaceae bacterium]